MNLNNLYKENSVEAMLEKFSELPSNYNNDIDDDKHEYSNDRYTKCTDKEKEYFCNHELYDLNVLVGQSVRCSYGDVWNWKDVFNLNRDEIYRLTPKGSRKVIFPTSSTKRPVGNIAYSMWNGLQIIDLDIKNETLARQIKEDLFESLKTQHWFLGACLSSSHSGVHIWTKIQPCALSPDTRKVEFLCNFRQKYSYVYIILMSLAKKYGITKDDIISYIDMAMAKPQQAAFISFDDSSDMSMNFKDMSIDAYFNKIINSPNGYIEDWVYHPDLKEIFAKLDWFAKDKPEDIDIGDVEEIKEWDKSKNYRKHYKHQQRWQLANTLVNIYGFDKGYELMIAICEGTPSHELRSICATASTHNKPIAPWAINELNKYHGFSIKIKDTEDSAKTKAELLEKEIAKDDTVDPIQILNENMDTTTLHIKKDQYLSDIQNDILSNLKHITLLEAGAGYGKTEMIKRLEGRVLLILPFTSTIKAKIEASTETSDWLYYYGTKRPTLDELFSRNSMSMTIDKFSRLNLQELDIANFDYIVLDESHLLFTSSYRNVMSPAIQRLANVKTKVIMMTGTPTGEVLFFPKIKHIKVIKEDTRIKQFKVRFYPQDVELKLEMCKNIAKDIIDGKKILYPTNKGNLYYQEITGLISKYLLELGYKDELKSFYYKKSNTGESEMDSINIDKSIGNTDVIFCSSYLSVGVDICDKYKFAIYFTELMIPQDIEQYSNRIRNNDLYVNLYLPKYDSSGWPINYTDVIGIQLQASQEQIMFARDLTVTCNNAIDRNGDDIRYNPIVKSISYTNPYIKYDENYGQYYIDETTYKLHYFEDCYLTYYKQLPKLIAGMKYYGYEYLTEESLNVLTDDKREEFRNYISTCRREKYNKDTTETYALLDHITDENIDMYHDVLRGNYEICKSPEFEQTRVDNNLYVGNIEILEKNIPIILSLYKYYDLDIIKDIFEYCTQKSSNKINYSQLNRIRKFANIDASRRKRRLDFPIAKYIYDVKKFVEKNPIVDKKHDIEIFIGMYTIQYANSIANLIVDDKEYIEYLYSLLYDLWKILVIERRKNNQIHLSLFELLWSRKEDLINIYGGSNKIKNFFLDELIDNIKTETENTESENTEEEFDDFEKTEKKTLEQIKDELKTVIHKDYDYYIYSNEDGSNTRFLEKQENTKRTMTSESIIFTEPDNEEDKGKFGDLSLFATTDKDAPF